MIAKQLFSYVVGLQSEADRSFAQHPKNCGILPNDAIYMFRLTNLQSLCDLIEQLVVKSQKPLDEVIRLTIEPNKLQISIRIHASRSKQSSSTLGSNPQSRSTGEPNADRVLVRSALP
jgi:hypothetical protein